MELYCEENRVYVEHYNTEKEKRFRDEGSQPYLTRFSTTGQLYRACVKEHGRCTGKEYIDVKGKPIQVGWVFFKRATSKDQYDVETWVTVFTHPPQRKVTWEGAEYPTFGTKSKHHETSDQSHPPVH